MTEEINQDGGKMKELKLINSGSYGCIYRPTLTCNGNVGSTKYITKIQKNKRSIMNELYISKKIRNIVGYVRFFAPILKSCDVKIAKDRVRDLKKCEVFENVPEQQIEGSTYISMKTRYVGDKDLKKYIFSNLNSSGFLHELWRTHIHLLKGIQHLFKHRIVHYDLKYNNVMFDDARNEPIIIDFGQSVLIDDLKTEDQLSAAFFVFDQYDYWCIDILICSYIFHKIGYKDAMIEKVTEHGIDHIYDVFIHGTEHTGNAKKVVSSAYLYNILQNPSKMNNFETVFKEYARQFINVRTWWEFYEELVKNANTWDCYSLSVIYLNMLDDLFLYNPESYRNMVTFSNMRLPKYVELMESIIYSIPGKRPSVQMVINELERIAKM